MHKSDATLIEKIKSLKNRRNAIILAHNYQLSEVQDIADFIGDSLELSLKAAETDADVIVFCGVRFMAETASILCADKTVLLPHVNATCPMAKMVTPERLREKKKVYSGAKVVCYINTTAEVKAESDICCASSNAVNILGKLPANEEMIFVPDQYLGDYIATLTNHDMILWPGFCPTHIKIRPEDISRLKEEYPAAKLIVHPECIPQVRTLADAILSTGGMVRFARETNSREIIVGTEVGMLSRLRKENPDKKFIAASELAVCSKMKLITLETVLWSLENMTVRVQVPDEIRRKAKAAVDIMLEG